MARLRVIAGAREAYKVRTRRWLASLATSIALLVIVFILSIALGSSGICNPLELGCSKLVELRLPRSITAIAVGALLGVSGALLQAVTRNPLAEPFILGLSSGALATTSIAILLMPLILNNPSLLSLVAFGGALLAYVATSVIAEYAGGGALTLILAGVAVNAFFSGMAHFFSFLVQVLLRQPMLVLLLGTLAYTTKSDTLVVSIAALSIPLVYVILAKPLNTIVYGDLYSSLLGFNPRIIRRASVAIAALYTGIAVAITGIIGFIGLMSPHVARMVLKTSDHRFIVPFSAINGALLLLLADVSSRALAVYVPIGELPAGVYTSAIGGLFLAYMVSTKLRGIE
ncbi:MAG: iron ABC transporter permease [Pyrodictiaceae archaeon]